MAAESCPGGISRRSKTDALQTERRSWARGERPREMHVSGETMGARLCGEDREAVPFRKTKGVWTGHLEHGDWTFMGTHVFSMSPITLQPVRVLCSVAGSESQPHLWVVRGGLTQPRTPPSPHSAMHPEQAPVLRRPPVRLHEGKHPPGSPFLSCGPS